MSAKCDCAILFGVHMYKCHTHSQPGYILCSDTIQCMWATFMLNKFAETISSNHHLIVVAVFVSSTETALPHINFCEIGTKWQRAIITTLTNHA